MRFALNTEKAKDKARRLELKGQTDKAIEIYARILQDLDGTPELSDELALYNKLGDLYLKGGDIQPAVEQYETAIAYYADQGFPNNAIALCNKVLRNAPGRTHVYLKLAKLMMERGFVAEAKQNLLEYAERMQKAGQVEEAFQALKEFADLSPDNEEIRLMLAEQLKKAARTDEAREQLAKLYHELQTAGDQRRVRTTLERMKAIDPAYDVEATPAPKVESKKQKTTDIVFIDLDEPVTQAQTADATAEAVTVDSTLAGGANADESVAAVDIGVEHSAAPDTSADEVEEVSPIEGLDAPTDFTSTEASDVGGLDIEHTTLVDADSPVSDVGDDALELEEPDEIDRELAATDDAADLPEGGDLPMLELPGVDDTADRPVLDQAVDEGGVEVPELDMSFEQAASGTGEISLIDEEQDEDEHVEVPTIEPDVEADIELAMDEPGEAASGDQDDFILPAPEPEAFESLKAPALEEAEFAPPDISALEDEVLEDADAAEPHRALGEALIETGERDRGLQELDIALNAFENAGAWGQAQSVLDEILRLDPNSLRHHQRMVEYALRDGDVTRLIGAYLELADGLVRDGGFERARNVYERVLEHDATNERAVSALRMLPDELDVVDETLLGTDVDDIELEDLEDEEQPASQPAAVSEEVDDGAVSETHADEPERLSQILEVPDEVGVVEDDEGLDDEAEQAEVSPPEPSEAVAASARESADFVDLGALILEEDRVKDTRMRIAEDAPTGDEERDFQDMLSEFKKGIDANIDIDDSEAHYDLGIAFKEMGLLDEAIAEFQKALREQKGRLRAAEALGLCFYEKGQFAVAGTVLRRAVDDDARGDEAKIGLLYWLGRSEEEQGNAPQALACYQRIFSIDVEFQDVKARVKELTG